MAELHRCQSLQQCLPAGIDLCGEGSLAGIHCDAGFPDLPRRPGAHISLVFARCGIPLLLTGSGSGYEGWKLTFVVSHISRKTSEMWGTRHLWQVRKVIIACTLAMAPTACRGTRPSAMGHCWCTLHAAGAGG